MISSSMPARQNSGSGSGSDSDRIYVRNSLTRRKELFTLAPVRGQTSGGHVNMNTNNDTTATATASSTTINNNNNNKNNNNKNKNDKNDIDNKASADGKTATTRGDAEGAQRHPHSHLQGLSSLHSNNNDDVISWYICGPTVYDHSHLGHARTYICFDIIHRIMTDFFNRRVFMAMGMTDVDDKIINRANERQVCVVFLE